MSMIKVILPQVWNFDAPVAQLIKVSSRGLLGSDRTALVKRAGERFAHELERIKFAHDEVPVHLLAVGSTEDYGPNRNGDGFRRAICDRYHPTFVKYARFYRNHKNKNPAISYGLVKLSAYNPTMKRIELICALNGSEDRARANGGLLANEELEKLAREEDIAVSMACFTDPEYPILTRDRGYVRIADVNVGDHVWTHRNRWRRVTRLNRRRYTGEVRQFKMNGLPFPLELTADHPMWAKVFQGSRKLAAVKSKAARYFQDPEAFAAAPAGWTHAEHIETGDRFFHNPVTQYPEYGRIACPDLAAIMGYYVAEGSFGYNGERACTTEFTCNLDDSAVRRIPQIMSRLYPDIAVDIKPHPLSDQGLKVSVSHTGFSEFLRQQLGAGAKRKLIPPEIFNADRDIKLAFLGAWLDGDGWPDKKGIHWSTASINLVLQGRDLLVSLGIPASVYKIDHSKCATSGYDGSGIEYTLNISHLDAWQLAEYSAKVANYRAPAQRRTKPAALRRCPDGTYALRISAVVTRFVTDCETFNFEVEDDESYSAAGLISHNCRVPYDICSHCGNKAVTKEDYCDSEENGGHCKAGGLKQNMGMLLKDGSVIHADNTEPTFFDISHVFRPADRIAYVLGQLTKAASAQRVISGAELAVDMGVTAPYEILMDAGWTAKVASQAKLAYRLAELDDTFRTQRLPVLSLGFAPSVRAPLTPPPVGQHKLSHVLRALADSEILLSPAEFLKLTTNSDEKQASVVADATQAALPGIYQRLIADPNLERTLQDNPFIPAPATTASLQRWATKHASDFSLADSHFSRRLQLASLRNVSAREKRASENAPSAAVNRMATHYALYKLGFLQGSNHGPVALDRLSLLVALQNYV